MLIEILSAAALLAVDPPVVTEPSWRRMPSIEDIAEHYPDKAREAVVGGRVMLGCRVAASGRLNNCEVLSEDPEGYDFGIAALGLVGLMEMNPRTVDGKPVGDGLVRVPLKFTAPAEEGEGEDGDAWPADMDATQMLDDVVRCFGVLGAEFDADPTRQRLIPALDHLKSTALELSRYAGADRDAVRARLDAARESPAADADFVSNCRAGAEYLLKTP
jgi:TonB family protein